MEQFIELFSLVMNVPKEGLTLETSKDEIGNWDSFSHLRLVSELEEKFEIIIPYGDIPNLKRIGDFLKYLKE
ncbi:acyl carrier protein [Sporomusa aerivorans]|uniref:acyl carrier protein n=1 Tax=Sporomusa aerivorans TaxID=204936 RepID=UPI00352A9E9D